MNEKELYKVIGQNIKKYRTEYNKKNPPITQEKLAEIVNVSVSFISSLESEKVTQGISAITLYNISKALNVTIEELIKKEK